MGYNLKIPLASSSKEQPKGCSFEIKKMKKNSYFKKRTRRTISELRFDIVSEDWVVIATGRAKRPETFKKEKREIVEEKGKCPFCDLSEQLPPVYNSKNIVVIPNLYPAFSIGNNLNERDIGPYRVMDGVGFHEVIVIKEHEKDVTDFSLDEMKELVDCYQARYLELKSKPYVNYISIFHNHGKEAGASIVHPHSQLIAIPMIDPDLNRSLNGSKRYWQYHNKCPHCVMLYWDIKDGQRVIFENKDFVVLCPFASHLAFEVRIYPKDHQAYFEKIDDSKKVTLAEALMISLKTLFKGLDDPPYNFFLHTAPCDEKEYGHYHWHFEILPKTNIPAGFELGTGIEISTIEPEKAAKYLRKFI